MVLGRTSSGAIKIKTDGSTRAVNCGCCGDDPGGCEITEAQFNAIRFGGTYDIGALTFPNVRNQEFYQDFEDETTDSSGTTTITGSISGFSYDSIDAPVECIYTPPGYPEPPWDFTYTVNETAYTGEFVEFYASYTAVISASGAATYTLQADYALATRGCSSCSATEPDTRVDHTEWTSGGDLCGAAFYRWLMEADTSSLSNNADPVPPECP